MISGLTKQELTHAEELTSKALQHAAQSFSKIVREDVSYSDLELNPKELNFGKDYLVDSDVLLVLETDFMGEILADSFLVFNSASAKRVVEKMFRRECGEAMRDAALLELDNIVAASIATRFSDSLDKDIKGDVPRIEKLSYKESRAYISGKLQAPDTHFGFAAIFECPELGMQAYFICAFRQKFVTAIREWAAQPLAKNN